MCRRDEDRLEFRLEICCLCRADIFLFPIFFVFFENMAGGYCGRILRVDLSDGNLHVEEPEGDFYRRYLGGMGMISYYLLKETKQGVDPLGPENLLVFATGVVTGAPLSGSGRHAIGAKSPLTGGFGVSEVGGYWGAEVKRAGFDAIIIRGKSPKPVYLWVHDKEAEIRDAGHLWTEDVGTAHEIIGGELKDQLIRVAEIGPAGEKRVRFAAVVCDLKHTAGRTGMGAVMGSKNLKAVAVRGHAGIEIANVEKIREMALWFAHNVGTLSKILHEYGTGAAMEAFELTGNLPVRNFRDGIFPNAGSISAQAVKEKVRVGMWTCFACAVRCKKEVRIGEPWNVDPKYGGPEYETLAAFGSTCGVDGLEAICKANEICQRAGLDTISAGVAISFAMECYENGLISKEETGGIDLNFGNASSMLTLLQKIVDRKDIGDVLAEGVKGAAEKIGKDSWRYAVHVKGQEVPMHEPRLKRGLGLGYSVSPTGADHMHNIHDNGLTELQWKDMQSLGVLQRVAPEDLGPRKVQLAMNMINSRILDNCLVMCNFPPWSLIQKTDVVNAITGWNTSLFELMKTAERTLTLARIFNIREGFNVEDDWLPNRFFQPKRDGALSNTSVNPQELQEARRLYYGMMGWDQDTGVPKAWKLAELDVSWAADHVSAE